jgi:hypothetical protein
VLIVRTPDGRLTFLQALGSRRKGSVGGGIPAAFTGYLITDGYTGYQHLLSRIKGIQQCAQHVIRRARAVEKLGPGGVQNWAADIITVLGEAHRAVEDARARGSTALDQQVLDDLRERYDTAVTAGFIHNRLRDWDTGNHPGYSLACWLREYKEQVFLFTRNFAVSWTNNVSERGAKAPRLACAVGWCPRSADSEDGVGCDGSAIVRSSRCGSRDTEQIGSARDDVQVEVLTVIARQRVTAGQGELRPGPRSDYPRKLTARQAGQGGAGGSCTKGKGTSTLEL